ncbi:MAG TPA: hypothetical protein DCM22_06100 [Lachnospiraceae bacterium]|nr:hypothetical protein [Lachnospiraceae bacterium]
MAVFFWHHYIKQLKYTCFFLILYGNMILYVNRCERMRGIFHLILQKSRFDSVNLHTASVRLRKHMGKQTMRCMACSLQQEDGDS